MGWLVDGLMGADGTSFPFSGPRALRAEHESPPRCRVACATETMGLRIGLKVAAIGSSFRYDWATCSRGDLRRPQAHRFTLRVSATRRDTKWLRQHEISRKHRTGESSAICEVRHAQRNRSRKCNMVRGRVNLRSGTFVVGRKRRALSSVEAERIPLPHCRLPALKR